MNVLYIESKTHLKRDIEWTWYLDSTEEEKIWDKYAHESDKLIVIAPYEKSLCIKDQKDLIKLGNKYALEDRGIELQRFEDLYDYETNTIDKKAKDDIIFLIERNICRSDIELIVINSEDTFYKQIAVNLCDKHNKKYILENNKVTV